MTIRHLLQFVISMCAAAHAVLVMPAIAAGTESPESLEIRHAHSSSSTVGFLIFDATLYGNKPDLSTYGVRELPVIYQGQLWNGSKDPETMPSRATIQSLVAKIPDDAAVICIDIEKWPLKGDDNEVARSLEMYIEVMRRFHAFGHRYRLGYYGVPPVRDYWRAIKDPMSTLFRQWQFENVRLSPLATVVDVLFPSLYTFYSDQEGWRRMAIAQLNAAKAYGKPVYVFLWPQFHESNRLLSGRYIGDDYWRMELETVRRYADGVVIWGGWVDGKPAKWDSQASWWQVTKTFLEDSRRTGEMKNR